MAGSWDWLAEGAGLLFCMYNSSNHHHQHQQRNGSGIINTNSSHNDSNDNKTTTKKGTVNGTVMPNSPQQPPPAPGRDPPPPRRRYGTPFASGRSPIVQEDDSDEVKVGGSGVTPSLIFLRSIPHQATWVPMSCSVTQTFCASTYICKRERG